jgi:hypothetical protein
MANLVSALTRSSVARRRCGDPRPWTEVGLLCGVRASTPPATPSRPLQVIGSEVQIQAVDGRLVRTATPILMDDGPGKTVHLWDRTGTQPVLAAGNAADEIDTLRAARFALVVHHDDDVREYACDDPQILNAAAGGGWTVISIRDDFARVWPAGIADDAR